MKIVVIGTGNERDKLKFERDHSGRKEHSVGHGDPTCRKR